MQVGPNQRCPEHVLEDLDDRLDLALVLLFDQSISMLTLAAISSRQP